MPSPAPLYRFNDTLIACRVPLLPATAAISALAGEEVAPWPLIQGEHLRKALYLANVSLYEALIREDGAERSAEITERLCRQVARMSTRQSPYGLSATIGVVRIAKETTLRLAANSLQTRSRVDMGWLNDLIREIEGDSMVRSRVRLFDAGIGFAKGDRVFLELGSPRSIRRTTAVDIVLERAKSGATVPELRNALRDALAVTDRDAEQFVVSLWNIGLLVSELIPSLAHTPFIHVQQTACRLGYKNCQQLEELRARVSSLDDAGSTDDDYVATARFMEQLVPGSHSFLHVDSVRSFEVKLARFRGYFPLSGEGSTNGQKIQVLPAGVPA